MRNNLIFCLLLLQMWHLPTLSTSSVSLGTSNNANSGTSTSSNSTPGTGSSQQSDPLSTNNPTSSSSTNSNQIVPETMQTSVKDEFNHSVTSNYAAADYSLQNLDNYYTKTSEEVPKSNSATAEEQQQQQNNSNNTGYLSTD